MPEQLALTESGQLDARQDAHIVSALEPSQKLGELAPLCSVLQRSAQPPADMSVTQAHSQGSESLVSVSLVSVSLVSVSVSTQSVSSVASAHVSDSSVSVVVELPHATPNAANPAMAATPMPI
jgi:hypothetical protein